jgi:MFS family permease
MPLHDAFAALRERNYQLYAGGWLPASIGIQMQATALAWEVYERTGDALSLGIIGLARALPTVILALPAGQIVDLVNRQRVMIATQIGFTIAGALLAIGSIAWWRGAFGDGSVGLWVMYGLIALTGCARVFNGPSRSSLLPLILPGGASGPVFHNAVTWNSGVFHLAAMLGPIAAGGMIYWTGQAWPVYVVAAAGCLFFALTACFIRPYEPVRVERNRGLPRESIWAVSRPSVLLPGMLEGARHVWREKTVFGAIALDLFAVLLGGATALMPVYAKDILHVGPIGLGVLKSAPYVGALLMALILAGLPPFRRAGPALLWSVGVFGACTVVFGLSTSFLLSVAMLIALGAADNISVVIRHVLVSVRTPDRLRGRVSAVNMVFIESSNELGGFESGLVAKLVGPVFSVVSGGIGTILVVIGMACWLPELRKLGRLSDTPASASTCGQCGYNLTGNSSGRCPECGTEIALA